MDVKKIIITGAESCGKSWLTKKLAAHFEVPFADEYARHYLEKHGAAYDFNTLEKIIHGHLEHQRKAVQAATDVVFLDTDLLNFKIWEEVVFSKTHDFLDEAISRESDHRYLLTYPDIPWEEDPLRENPKNRMELFERHLELIQKVGRPYQIVKGEYEVRFKNALKGVEKLLEQS